MRRPSPNDADAAHTAEALTAKLFADHELRTPDGRNLAAVLLGRRGGLKGGRARANSLSAERRSEIAKLAAAARWSRK